jgi:hypothetical protein
MEIEFSSLFFDKVYTDVYISGMNELSPSHLLQQIAQIQRMEPGKLCVLRQGPNGPYYNLQCREDGRPVSRYVPPDQVETVARHTANYQKFQILVAQYAQVVVQQTRTERAAGSKKKKRSRPRSSWPRTKKSNG